MNITPIENKVFGAVVTNVKLANLNDNELTVIKTTFLKHGLLLFPAQFLSVQENISFGERFGELEFGGIPMANQEKNKDGTYGRIFELETQRMRTNVGNEAWHTDSSYKPASSKCAMLSAITVPDEGGGTEFVDTRAAYAALDQATKDRINTLSAYHSTQYSQANDVGDFPVQTEASIYHGEAYLRPLVKTHPETGIKSLFIGRHAFGIPGLSREESRKLLKSLLDFVLSDKSRIYRHKWQAGDTLFWDNRCLLHCAMPYDYSKARVLTATRVAGDPESELAYHPSDPAAQAGRDALAAELELLKEETVDRMFGATTTTSTE
ncbi:MAG TPA: TauD/TfdA family dioxygenase [Arenicellales bacterium]|jgi:alpha-ketoglutarate-dependent taurine dioxygenase|nr:taurine catabolism dioxygenase TauD [Gammaproteobacteria bacterium]MDP6026013.1 TauD/TfdA family dioxygenase [Pseudomonadales bacterium]HJL52790.1 TauD/TfdA family dioxygenase [Arenicellales bacterium]MDP6317009.1 TauD/TfdA family dioxygenase [Pseudomonadales bacterium]MDP7313932.1 TauD/TfdA family dioxygenase [Pseudomonadales bacterium]|tara:strand:+ start:7298 stop:8263 length:966 start_codon:yes stop_codon:yes gene_type:complete